MAFKIQVWFLNFLSDGLTYSSKRNSTNYSNEQTQGKHQAADPWDK